MTLAPARDLAADAKLAASAGVPLIVMVSLPGCPHCEVVRRSHLLPLLRDAAAPRRPLIRQVEMNGQGMLRDFSGRATTHAIFASRYHVKIAPVVMFFDAEGELISQPLVGSMIPDFYGAYFDAAFAEAVSKLPVTRP
jgi:thioredoxin-related protein